MNKRIRVLVHGTGFAGQGHAQAFQYVNADVVGIVGRTDSVVKQVAKALNIPYAGTDWKQALIDCRPDVVSIATPGGAHLEAIQQAIELGCHVFSDKPLTDKGDTASLLHEMAQKKQVKTAFAASFRYAPEVIHAKQLVASGVIGEPLEVECMSHFNLERTIPFGWSHRKEDGGGRLNNNFTHVLSIVTAIVGENIVSIMGEVRDDLGRAPIVHGIHNFNERRSFIPEDIEDPALMWGESNVEWSYTVLAQIDSALAQKPVSVLFKHGGLQPRFHEDHIVVYGSKGALYIKGHYGSGPLYLYGDDKQWKEIALPEEIANNVPEGPGETEQNWRHLIREFVKDIQGEPVAPYQTFKEGSQYQQLIDLIRENRSWTDVRYLQQANDPHFMKM